jgi:hypothetical protein
VDDGDRQRRQLYAAIEARDPRIIPLEDAAHEDVAEQRTGQLDLAGPDARQVHDRYDAAHHGWKLVKARGVQLVDLERLVRCTEIDRLGLDLLDTTAGADRLIVKTYTRGRLVGFRPFRIERRRKGGARARDIGSGGRRSHAGGQGKPRTERGKESLEHEQSLRCRSPSGARSA